MNQMPFPGPPKLFHARIVALFVVLYLTDAVMILYAVESVQTKGVGAIVLFASEVRVFIDEIRAFADALSVRNSDS